MKNLKVVIVMLAVLPLVTGCASTMLEEIQQTINKQQVQQQKVFQLAQNPDYLTPDGHLYVPVVVKAIEVKEVEKRSDSAASVLDAFGPIASLAADVVDTTLDGEVISIKQYVVTTADGFTLVIAQPEGDDYQDDFKDGDSLLYVSAKPITEGQNQMHLVRR